MDWTAYCAERNNPQVVLQSWIVLRVGQGQTHSWGGASTDPFYTQKDLLFPSAAESGNYSGLTACMPGFRQRFRCIGRSSTVKRGGLVDLFVQLFHVLSILCTQLKDSSHIPVSWGLFLSATQADSHCFSLSVFGCWFVAIEPSFRGKEKQFIKEAITLL